MLLITCRTNKPGGALRHQRAQPVVALNRPFLAVPDVLRGELGQHALKVAEVEGGGEAQHGALAGQDVRPGQGIGAA